MRKTIKKVTIVVLVLMTNCHVSEKLNSGPVIPHARITRTASTNAHGEPVAVAAPAANRRKACFIGNDLFMLHERRAKRRAAASPSSDQRPLQLKPPTRAMTASTASSSSLTQRLITRVLAPAILVHPSFTPARERVRARYL